MLNVIYEDNHLLVVEKPVNVPVQADSTGDPDLLSEAKAYIKRKYNKPGDVYLGLVHRLDRPVGGVMVFARTSKAAARLTDSMKTRRVQKRYAAIVAGGIPPYGELRSFIIKDETDHSAKTVAEGTPGAKPASLDYTAVTTKNGRTLVDILLHTGRHHQIRAQFAEMGRPLFGDQRYNKSAVPGQQIALYAYSLTIEHPTLHDCMTFTCVPTGKSWEGFADELTALSCGVRCRYIDENVIVVNKSAGVACAAADGGEDTLEARLASAFGEVHPVHRLDVPTTGLVLFARNAETEDVLTSLIRSRRIKKLYHTMVFEVPQEVEGTLLLYAEKDPDGAMVRVFSEPGPGRKEMHTGYRVLDSRILYPKNGAPVKASLVEAELFTGRTHQIRASFAHIGCPVIGDDKYGDRDKNRLFSKELALSAVELGFPDEPALGVLSGRTIKAEAPFEWTGELKKAARTFIY